MFLGSVYLAAFVTRFETISAQARTVSQDEEAPTRRVHLNGVVPLLEERASRLDARGNHVGQVDLFAPQRDLASRDSRYVEQVVDQAHQVLHLPVDDQPLALEARVAARGHQLDGRHDRRQGVPELVPEHGEELVFHGVGALGLRSRGHEVAHRQRLDRPRAREARAAAHPRQELAARERLPQVIVGARLEAFDSSLVAGPGRQHDDRNLGGGRVAAHLAQQAEAVEPGHHHVCQDEIVGSGTDRGERFDPVDRHLDRPVGAQEPRDVFAHVGVVVDDEDPLAFLDVGRRAVFTGRLPAERFAHVEGSAAPDGAVVVVGASTRSGGR